MDTTSTERSARIRQATPAEHIVTSAMAVKRGARTVETHLDMSSFDWLNDARVTIAVRNELLHDIRWRHGLQRAADHQIDASAKQSLKNEYVPRPGRIWSAFPKAMSFSPARSTRACQIGNNGAKPIAAVLG
jgi:hypothetical protein